MKASFPTEGSARFDTAADTQAWGVELGQALEAGDVVILDGPLGAGKTTLTQGIARGMGVKGRVTSPTFVIAREHRPLAGGPALIHVDAYRLLDSGTDPLGALDSLDLDTDLLDSVVVAEWGGGLVEQIAQQYLFVQVDRETAVAEDPTSEARIISWQWRG
ncbi:tRNA (adenosine(37)-N6)-threonylcarbamoyltransferase complex ATPase subunit type 1 TsaE [Corynebacterium hindlerae]|uniref:tRNA threonylcarbamoyladenosine biosynthesis protein TsaE n=1 Tax=Corynebacterium hindlerae TaxID=699041 RepID=A0A7G5FHJ1_9CORY|nr:tRNA (adenosine(37)-N6)-threonylcarbamoyltransferase complex ATPase subunit type 1 TsaE [Corynebacterium hindlerae]QMV86082.1 tRNA (adenosine(37)-N6)-threonylcarbamoyltransferase complex ATPase subunit type 1 TsaE [Corynebacterium hindlerae]QTH60266.1 tRNA (adenosine(37)-N6)-threonylcarbamoyltransferase complex ATPase subunit type 1 TsaE [Corynebacterium hindlerae]